MLSGFAGIPELGWGYRTTPGVCGPVRTAATDASCDSEVRLSTIFVSGCAMTRPPSSVIVEERSADPLAGLRARRDVALITLLVVIGLAAGLGVVTAARFAAPLRSLTHAAERLSAGDDTALCPGAESPNWTISVNISHRCESDSDSARKNYTDDTRATGSGRGCVCATSSSRPPPTS